jgi:hypothetical protein
MYHILPNSWNAIASLEYMTNPKFSLESFYKENYFIHFAGRFKLDEVHLLH